MDQNLDFREVIKEELEQFDVYLTEALKSNNHRVSDIVNHAFKVEGKRIRPTLVLLVAKACGGVSTGSYHGAVTVELLHTATLVHDDVIDESLMRRGQASVNALFDNQRSVLGGDYLLSTAILQSVKTGNMEIVEIISELGKNLSEGELDQFALANEVIIDEAEYFEVINKKTASLLYACAKIGAITGGASRHNIEEFGRMGRYLGIAFQIRDDIFDYYNNDVGKPTGNDIREGKITLPLIYALQNCDEATRVSMMYIITSRDYTTDNIDRLLSFAKEQGGVDYAYKKLNSCLLEAEKIVDDTTMDNDYKEVLKLLFTYLKERKY